MGPGSQPACLWPGWLSHMMNAWARVSPSSQAYVGLAVIEGDAGRRKSRSATIPGAPGQRLPLLPFLLLTQARTHLHALLHALSMEGPEEVLALILTLLVSGPRLRDLGCPSPPLSTDVRLGARIPSRRFG